MSARSKRRPRALLLDDDPAVLRLLARALEARGHEVLAAMDAACGLDLLLDSLLDLDVVVIDEDLPGRDAWSLLRLIRGPGGERELPVVVLAGGPDARVRAQLRSLGADAVVDRLEGPAAAAEAVARAAARSPAEASRPPSPLAGAALALRDALRAAPGRRAPAAA